MAADYSLLGPGFSVANALAMQGAGQQQADRNRDMQLRERLRTAYDPTTGQLDPVAARTAYADAGDIKGAMGVDRQTAEARKAQYETAMERLNMTAQLLNGVSDETSFQRAKQQAQAAGLDVSGIPQQFDPNWVQTTRQQALTVQQQLAAERDRWVPIGERGLLNVSDPNAVAAYQRSQGAPAQQQAMPQPGAVEDGYRFKGGNPADPASWEPMGGAPSQGGATFP